MTDLATANMISIRAAQLPEARKKLLLQGKIEEALPQFGFNSIPNYDEINKTEMARIILIKWEENGIHIYSVDSIKRYL